MTHQSPRQERFCIVLPFTKDNVFISFICLVQPKPYPPKIDLLQEAFTNMLPRRTVTMGTDGAESGPVAIIEENLQATLPGKLARLDVKDDNPGLCDRKL